MFERYGAKGGIVVAFFSLSTTAIIVVALFNRGIVGIDLGRWATSIAQEGLPNFRPRRAGSADFEETELLKIDRQAAQLDYKGNSASELALLLSKMATTDLEKARSAYAWIVTYVDCTGDEASIFFNSSSDSLACAKLYQALMTEMEMDSVVVEGQTKKRGIHAWNAVRIEGEWYLLDTTLGASTPNLKDYYFAVTPSELIASHFPSNPSWQLLPLAISLKQFLSFPDLTPQFFQNGLKLLSHEKNIETDAVLTISLEVPPNYSGIARLTDAAGKKFSEYTFAQSRNGRLEVSADFPVSGDYQLDIFAGRRKQKVYPRVVTYQITAEREGLPFPKQFTDYRDRNIYLLNPLVGDIPDNRSIQFKIFAPKAQDVQVIDTLTAISTPLSVSNGIFEGRADFFGDRLIVIARFSEERRYVPLLLYR